MRCDVGSESEKHGAQSSSAHGVLRRPIESVRVDHTGAHGGPFQFFTGAGLQRSILLDQRCTWFRSGSQAGQHQGCRRRGPPPSRQSQRTCCACLATYPSVVCFQAPRGHTTASYGAFIALTIVGLGSDGSLIPVSASLALSMNQLMWIYCLDSACQSVWNVRNIVADAIEMCEYLPSMAPLCECDTCNVL